MVAYSSPSNLKDKLGPRLVRNMMLKKVRRRVKSHPAKYVDSLMRAVGSKENIHTLSSFPLIVIHLE